MPYAIEFTNSARREFEALDRASQRRIAPRIDALATHPFPSGAKKLQGERGLFRIRAGDYRIVYQVDGKRITVLILKIGHRREVYR
ncbi:MAG: type II toxin-antitoxin system RelE/ParE family toxin [Terriglobales bacterium]